VNIKKDILLGVLLCFSFQHLEAQTLTPVPACVKMDLNVLQLGADSSAFNRFFNKMQGLSDSKFSRLSIVHIGGSHVQAGIWSNSFSSQLQTTYHTSGGGYFGFPYKLAKTNGQHYLTTFSSAKWKKCRAAKVDYCLPLGMSGLSVSTNDSAGYFGAALNQRSSCRSITTIRVYHNFNPSFSFSLQTAGLGAITRRDQVAAGYSVFSFENATDSLVFNFTRCDTNQQDLILYGFSLENEVQSGVFLAALGLNGASANSFLHCSELSRQLPSLSADLYVLSLGVNDTQSAEFTKEGFYKNYDSLIGIIRASDPSAAILLTTTSDNFIRKKTLNKRTALARDVMFQLMNDRGVGVWDLYGLMGGPRSIIKWAQAGLASGDRVHFTGKGYVLLGQLMAEAFLSASGKTKLTPP
jgi:lysophospholipase L1-like esterase